MIAFFAQVSMFVKNIACYFVKTAHTYAKLIEIQKKYLQKIHGLHELGSHMECKDTLRGSELGPHSKFGPMGPKKNAQKFLYT